MSTDAVMSEFEQAFTILDARVDAEVFDLLRHVVLELNRVEQRGLRNSGARRADCLPVRIEHDPTVVITLDTAIRRRPTLGGTIIEHHPAA